MYGSIPVTVTKPGGSWKKRGLFLTGFKIVLLEGLVLCLGQLKWVWQTSIMTSLCIGMISRLFQEVMEYNDSSSHSCPSSEENQLDFWLFWTSRRTTRFFSSPLANFIRWVLSLPTSKLVCTALLLPPSLLYSLLLWKLVYWTLISRICIVILYVHAESAWQSSHHSFILCEKCSCHLKVNISIS